MGTPDCTVEQSNKGGKAHGGTLLPHSSSLLIVLLLPAALCVQV